MQRHVYCLHRLYVSKITGQTIPKPVVIMLFRGILIVLKQE